MKLFPAVTISLIFHLVLILLVAKAPLPDLKKRQPVEVTLIDSDAAVNSLQSQEKLKILRDNINPEKEDNLPNPKAKAWAEKTVRVEKETQALNLGLTQNRAGKKAPHNQNLAGKKKVEDSQIKGGKVGSLLVPDFRPPSPSGGIEVGASSISSHMGKDIKFGQFTAMNSERFLYSSFFSRIEEKIYYRWVSRVRLAMEMVDPKIFNKKEIWTSQIEVILDAKGNYVETLVNDRSGIDLLDKAAIEAFKTGAPFPNPPREMVRDNGRIHLKFAVSVYNSPFAGTN